ncbi:leucine-rich repeat protein [Mogibacterium sp.]|uniref:leucine-rich repeat protein n=1 Tax=Mogibacterium sp. TaxID=2049035 RepID=UPI00258084A5|nr:leucine-rich repeat protein [Mogibacterium sp.]MBN2935256.1 leucine-rich repeat protein [Mogibacterium sp.]
MDKKQSLAFLLSAMMVATPFSAFAAEDGTAPADADASAKAATEQSVENNQAKGKASVQEDAQLDENELPIVPGEGTGEEKKDETPASNAWEAADFTYGEWAIDKNDMLCPSNDNEAYLKTTVWVVTGLSDSGKAKLENNKDLVIPAKDSDGKKVQGVGKEAFKKMGLTSVQFPENVKTANDTNWDSSVKERGDFFIGNLAFQGNNLKEVTLPEGVFYVATNGFSRNPNLKEVTFPSTIKLIGNSAFAACAIEKLNFSENTDFPLAIDNIAFFNNKIKSVWLPDKTEKVTNMAFRSNTGVENGIVHLYIPKTKGNYVDNNAYQKPFVGDAIPAEAWAEKPWGTAHFTFDGTTITGLSESGKIKIQNDTNLVLPDQNAAGEDVTAIGNGTNGVGTFGYKAADGTVYAPDFVKLPAKLESIGNFAFSAVVDTKTSEVKHGVKAVVFPETLKIIGNTAFQNAPLTEVSLPDSVTSVGSGAFTNTEQATTHIEKVKLSKGMTAIPVSMFTNQKVKNVEIPEGIKTIGKRAFAGNRVETLKLSGTVEKIDEYAFWNNQIKELEIPGNVKTIGRYAFQRTQDSIKASINKVVLHEGLESIGKQAFYQTLTSECKSIDLPTTVKVLDAAAFEGNAKVTLISLVEDQVNAVGDYAKVVAKGTAHEIVLIHKVTFDAGEGKADAETARTDKDGKLAELPDAVRDGYTFEGWFTAAEGGVAVTADTVFDKDTTVFAHWKKNVVSATPSVKLSTSAYTYNGKVKTPGVKVSVNGTVLTKDNYSVSYGKGRKNVGKYTVKVTLKNDYAGSKTVSFKINPPKSAVKKLKKGKKSFTVYVKKQSKQTSGYQVQYSTSKKFKSPKTKSLTSYKKTSLKVKKLKKHKKYYVRVRTYKKVGKAKYYSSWSSAKSVKTK